MGADDQGAPRPLLHQPTLVFASVGYERFGDSRVFARLLEAAGIECVIDVRERASSRRCGYGKTALRQTLREVGIEYLHLRGLGNPKKYRDLYRAGQADAGRRGYRRYLLEERHDELHALPRLLTERHCALMCFEHEQMRCHRDVIIEALRDRLDIGIYVEHLGEP